MVVTVAMDLLVHLRRARDLADRHYAEPLDLAALASAAGVSKYHFLRCFTAEYGETPMQYLARRRIERATDLLRSTNLTVTEVCHLVGYSSLGSFSSRFTELVGMTPSAYQRTRTGPRIPGCWVFMLGLQAETSAPRSADAVPHGPQSRRSAPAGRALASEHPKPSGRIAVISNVSLVTVWVTDIDEAKSFYTDKLDFVCQDDIVAGPDFRWCTVYQRDHPELQLVLQPPGPPLDEDSADAIRRVMAKGAMHGVGLATPDCRKTFEELSAKGVEFIQEPADRPYGVEAVARDNSGNWLVIIERKEYSGSDSEA